MTAALISFIAIGLLAMQATSKSAAAVSKKQSLAVAASDEIPVTVEPGNAELERGTSLLVLARFAGKTAGRSPRDLEGQPMNLNIACH